MAKADRDLCPPSGAATPDPRVLACLLSRLVATLHDAEAAAMERSSSLPPAAALGALRR